ncbi:hypothetical protein JWH16_04405 [Xanthomonas campestris pv. campestris]|nr:hypothetical protein [Xanthomonas campestris pv. campestris]
MTFTAFTREALRDRVEAERRRDEADSLEARFVATMQRTQQDVRLVRNDVHVVMAYVDSLVRSFLLHTPPVPPEAVKAAAAAGDQRYARFMKNVRDALQGGAGLFEQIDEEGQDDSEPGDAG